MNIRKFRPFLVACFCALSSVFADRNPNVVVFLVDDLGYMDIGVNNPDCFYDTPHIDELAKASMRFTEGYAANPVCSPTRYSLLTGRYPTRVDATNFFPKNKKSEGRSGKYRPAEFIREIPLDEVTLADALKKQGYATFFAGKWHLGHGEIYRPQKRGFDINFGGHEAGGPYTGKRYFAPYKNPEIKEEGKPGEHLPDRLARETVNFIKENKDKPFLTYLSFYSVHTPLIGRKDLIKKYNEKLKKRGEKRSDLDFERVTTASKKSGKLRVTQNHAVYAAMVDAMDQAVGKVVKGLKDNGVWENTIIVFTSDNGGLSTSEGSPTSNKPLNGGKGWVYEGGIREPWIIRYPGVTKDGSISQELISSIDLFPTIAKAVGYESKQLIDGIDLKPALEGGKLDRNSLFWHYPHYSNQQGIPSGAIREGGLKLIENYEDGSVALYDLKTDIGELKDLSAEQPEQVKVMRERLHEWYQSVDAKFLRPAKNGEKPWRPSYMEAE